ncbi:hypothetical protein K505DRAFT_360494 [Melanomma pulvis-pyrius CBS 109.77]|uniref:Uncharacterized protein n=1 Tax=Melanomma pulvis-pyrius CBS 109.77 TaxID=1314802 RepID=A0A6A6XFA2_9PLEO|nr:hypothetical protein K505DRAFT_360494 [Melanomma pulvis-pyrius CBS 109.77]
MIDHTLPTSDNPDWDSHEDAPSETEEKNNTERRVARSDPLGASMRRQSIQNSSDKPLPNPDEDSAPTPSTTTPSTQITPGETSRCLPCDFCDKTYKHRKDLNRHNKKSKCATARPSNNVRNMLAPPKPASKVPISSDPFSCPRCKWEGSNRFAVQRHIRNACWKICDECCASGNSHCDGHRQNDNRHCSECRKKEMDCTKRLGPIQGCVPAQIPRSLSKAQELDQESHSSRPGTSQKRKAYEYLSPNLKPMNEKLQRKATPIISGEDINGNKASYGAASGTLRSVFKETPSTSSPSDNNEHGFGPLPHFPPHNNWNSLDYDLPLSIPKYNPPSFNGHIAHALEAPNPNSWPATLSSQPFQHQYLPQGRISALRSSLHQPTGRGPNFNLPYTPDLNNSFTPSTPPHADLFPNQIFPGLRYMPVTSQRIGSSHGPNYLSPPPQAAMHHANPRLPIPEQSAFSRRGFTPSPLLSQQFSTIRQSSTPGNFGSYQGWANDHQQSRMLQQAPGLTPSSSTSFSATYGMSDPPLGNRAFNDNSVEMLRLECLPQRNPTQAQRPDFVEVANNVDFNARHENEDEEWTQLGFDGQCDQSAPNQFTPMQEPPCSPPEYSPPPSPSSHPQPSRAEGLCAGLGPYQRRENFSIYEDNDINYNSGPLSMNSTEDDIQANVNTRSLTLTPNASIFRLRSKIKLPAYRDLTLPVTVTTFSPPKPTKNDPIIILKIKDIEDDDKHQRTHFTTIMLRRSQKFGPILNAYCEERGKRFLLDWNFIYWFRKPIPEDSEKQCGYILRWCMAPDCFISTTKDPNRGMDDDDVIEVVAGNPLDHYGPDVVSAHEVVDLDKRSVDQSTTVDEKIEFDGTNENDQGHTNGQHDETIQTARELQTATDPLREEIENLRYNDQGVSRLQVAYDGLRHLYEMTRAENQALLLEIQKLRGNAHPLHGLPMPPVEVRTAEDQIMVDAPAARRPIQLSFLRYSGTAVEPSDIKLPLVTYSDSEDDDDDVAG